MRTFEEIKASELSNIKSLMNICSNNLKKGGLPNFEERAMKMVVQDCQTYIDNIDEVTTIKIGAITNSLISYIQSMYKVHLSDYWQNFERFVEEYVIGLTPDGKLKKGAFFNQHECFELGVGVNELLCFKGHNPMSQEICDIFRQSINSNFGTNIPMSGVEEQALQDYEEICALLRQSIINSNFETNTPNRTEIDKAFIHLKEVQRDSGALKVGRSYFILATNQQYQEAKARCSERNIKK